nr:hypothetical protein [FCB group bacterium]
MKKLVAAVLLNIFLFAQTAPFEEFLVGFWPEYDHPGVLITIEMITPVDQLPVDFNIKLPAEANMALRSIDNPAGEKELVHQLINTEKGYNIMPVHVDQSKFYIQFY